MLVSLTSSSCPLSRFLTFSERELFSCKNTLCTDGRGFCTQANAKGYEQEIILYCVFLSSEREMIFYSTK